MAAITDAFLADSSGEVVSLELDEIAPEVSEEKVREAMDEFANPAMSAPVIFVLDNRNVVVRPEAYSKALSMKAEDGSLVPQVNKKKLMAAVRPAMKDVALSPVPATVRLVGGRRVVVRRE